MNTRQQSAVLLGLLAVTALTSPSALAFAPMRAWCGQWVHITDHRQLQTVVARAEPDTLRVGASADVAESAWRSWWHLDTSNPAVWIDRWSAIPSFWHTAPGCPMNTFDTNRACNASDASSLGAALVNPTCDLGARFADNQVVDIEVNSTTTLRLGSCGQAGFSQEGTWIHELGHGYGYDHFDDWLSTMNTVQPDISSCRVDRSQRPSSDSQQQHRAIYSLPDAVDAGGTAVVANGCSLAANAGCARSFGSWGFFLPGSTGTAHRNVRFTSMNMRNAWPTGSLDVAFVLSRDAAVDAGDVLLAESRIGPTFAGAIYEYNVSVPVPAWVIPPGQTWCILVQWDRGNRVVEADESDNVLKTEHCFHGL